MRVAGIAADNGPDTKLIQGMRRTNNPYTEREWKNEQKIIFVVISAVTSRSSAPVRQQYVRFMWIFLSTLCCVFFLLGFTMSNKALDAAVLSLRVSVLMWYASGKWKHIWKEEKKWENKFRLAEHQQQQPYQHENIRPHTELSTAILAFYNWNFLLCVLSLGSLSSGLSP